MTEHCRRAEQYRSPATASVEVGADGSGGTLASQHLR
jgi:hypothetical protein